MSVGKDGWIEGTDVLRKGFGYRDAKHVNYNYNFI